MTDDEKKKATSLPPPPTDDIDQDWGSRPSGTPPEAKDSKRVEASEKKAVADPKTDLTPPWKIAEKAKPAADDDEEDDDEDEEDDEEDDDEDEEDDEEDDDEDEDEEDRRKARARAAKARDRAQPKAERSTPSASTFDDMLPDWSPWVVLIGLLALGLAGGFGLLPFNANPTRAAAQAPSPTPTTSATKTRPSASALREMRERRRKAMGADGGADSAMIRASHLLVQYQGAKRSTQTRTKEEAKARAEEALKRAKKGEDFGSVVAAYTDEPGGAERKGDLSRFGHGQMVPAFEQAAFALKVNEISGIVETPFGFHVIKRTE